MIVRRLACGLLCAAAPMIAAAQPLAVDALPQWRLGVRSDLAFQTSAFLRSTAYSKPDKTADQAAADGAYGPLN